MQSVQLNHKIKLFDFAALTIDLPEYNLFCGQVGTVMEILANGALYKAEFTDREGCTYESLGLRADQFMLLRYEPTIEN